MSFIKKSIPLIKALPVSVVCAPSIVFASSGAGIDSLVVPGANFAIYVVLFAIIYRKFVAPQIKARSVDIAQQVNASQTALRGIEADLSELRDRLSEISSEKEEIQSAYSSEGDDLARLIIAKAQDGSNLLKKEATRRAEQEFKQVVARVKADAVAVAIESVRTGLETSLTAEKDIELRREALQTMVS